MKRDPLKDGMRQEALNSGFKSRRGIKATQSFETGLSECYEMLLDKCPKIGELVQDRILCSSASTRFSGEGTEFKTSQQKLNQGFLSSADKKESESRETYWVERKEKLEEKLITKIR